MDCRSTCADRGALVKRPPFSSRPAGAAGPSRPRRTPQEQSRQPVRDVADGRHRAGRGQASVAMSTSGAAVAQGGRKLRRMEGSLFKYGGDGAHVAFQSGTPTKGLMVYIGGLTDGLLACQYVPPLAAALQVRVPE
eukprot:scaffold3210_cov402-Prasinococcus_capsulatus_cf.AAC.5